MKIIIYKSTDMTGGNCLYFLKGKCGRCSVMNMSENAFIDYDFDGYGLGKTCPHSWSRFKDELVCDAEIGPEPTEQDFEMFRMINFLDDRAMNLVRFSLKHKEEIFCED